MRALSKLLLSLPFTVIGAGAAQAHITLSGLAAPKGTAEVTVNVPHGCTEKDPAFPNDTTKDKHYPAYKVKVDIQPGVTSVKTFHVAFGKAALTKDATGNVTSVTWTKDGADEATDEVAFRFIVRGTFPDAPFTKAYFPATAYCRKPGGGEDIADPYTALPDPAGTPDAGAPVDAAAPVANAAPFIVILPARTPGWNKYTVPVAIPDVSVFFKDASIVWAGTAAYSANAVTADLIKKEPGTTVLTSVAAGTEIWVKY
jgi:uncharacterized protein YcnI